MSPETPKWRKASRSNNHGGECVEVADNLPGRVLVRDSKDPGGPVLAFDRPAWSRFLHLVRSHA